MPQGNIEDLQRELAGALGVPPGGPPAQKTEIQRQEQSTPQQKALSEAGVKLIQPAMANEKVDWQGESLDFRQKFSDVLAAMPPELRDKVVLESGKRSTEQQAEIYARSGQSTKFMAAPPGHSMHEIGGAGDVRFTDKQAEALFRKLSPDHGLIFPFMDRDPNHVQLAGLQKLANREIVAQKRQGSMDDLRNEFATVVAGQSPEQRAAAADEEDEQDYVDPIDQSPGDTAEPTMAFLSGAARGSVNLVAGPAQTVLEQVAPEQAVAFTAQMNDWEERLGMLEMARKQPAANAVGEIVGMTAGVMAGSGLIGATKAGELIGQAAQYVPKVVRGAVAGFALAGTTFHEQIDEGNRWLEGAVGGVFGGIAPTISWGTRYIAGREAMQHYLETLKASVGQWNQNLSGIKDAFVQHYRMLTDEANRLYEVRNAAGKAFDGFDPERLTQAIGEAIPSEARKAGVSTTVTTNRVRDELGLYQYEAEKSAHNEALATYRKEEEAWQKAAAGLVPGGISQAAREKIIQEAGDLLPKRPQPVGEFVPNPISANRFAAGMQAIHRARLRASDATSKRQLSGLEKSLNDAAADAAELHGMPVSQFRRDMEKANEYFRDNIGPIRDLFGKASVDEIERGAKMGKPLKYTNAFFAKQFSQVLKANDVEKMAALGKALGPTAREKATEVVEYEMLQTLTEGMKGQTPTRGAVENFAKYIGDRKEGLQQLLGRDKVTELEGFAKLANDFVQRPTSRMWGWATHSFLPFVGAEQIVEGIWQGDTHKVGRGTMLIAAPYAVHALHDMFVKIRQLPYLLPMVREAAKYKPGTPEFDKVVRQIETRAIGVGAVTGRAAVEQTVEAPQ